MQMKFGYVNLRNSLGSALSLPGMKLATFFLLTAFACIAAVRCTGPLQAKSLRCERNLVELDGVELNAGSLPPCRFTTDSPRPLFSWTVEHSERGATQIAYRVVVYSAKGGSTALKMLWDSGRVESGDSSVRYGGPPLHSLQQHYFTVQWWDQDGMVSPISSPGCFFTSFIHGEWTPVEAEWITAKSITGAPLFRKEFDTNEGIIFGTIGISGLGFYRLFVNGIEMNTTSSGAPAALRPAWTQYDRRTPMDVFVLDSILKGKTKIVIGVMLGLGWRNQKDYPNKDHLGQGEDERVLRVFIQVALPNFNLTSFGTDDSWLVHASPIVSDSIYDGETYNASMEIPNWSSPDYKPTGIVHEGIHVRVALYEPLTHV